MADAKISMDGATVAVAMGSATVAVTEMSGASVELSYFGGMTVAGTHHYPIGSKPEITATFRNSAGTLTTPTTIVFMLKDPAGTETTVTSPNAAITTVSTGVIKYTHGSTVATAGMWNVRAKGTAGLVAAIDDSFIVDPSPFTTP